MAVLQIRDDLSAEQREDRANELMEEFTLSTCVTAWGSHSPG